MLAQSLTIQVKNAENKREVRAVEVRNATRQVRALQACVTETLSHTHTPFSVTAVQILSHKDHTKAPRYLFLRTLTYKEVWGAVLFVKKNN